MNREAPLVRAFYSFLGKKIIPKIEKTGVSPDRLTLIGFLISCVSAVLFVFSPPLGALFLLLSGLFDVLDGFYARHAGKDTAAGAFLDSVADRYGEIVVFLGLWGYFYRMDHYPLFATTAVYLAITGSLMVSYTRARGEGMRYCCKEGFFQRTERVLFLAACGFLDPLLSGTVLLAGVAILALGANLTALSRLFLIRKHLMTRRD